MATSDRTNDRQIDLGTGIGSTGGEPIRNAFEKINQNFDDLYSIASDLSNVNRSIIPDANEIYNIGSPLRRFNDIYLSGSTINLGNTTISVNNNGELEFDGVKVPTQTDLNTAISNVQSGALTGYLTGDVTGSVYADDSTLLVDGVAGKIVGPIDTAQQAIFTDSIVIQNNNDIITLGDAAGASFQLPNKGVAFLGGGVDGGTYNIAFTANGNGSILVTEQLNILSGAGMAIGTVNGLTINNTVTVDAAVTAPSFVGDVTGSVFADDSAILVDGVNGKIVGEVDTANGSISNITTTNLYAANSTGVNISANGFNNLVVKETEVLVQNVALKTNSLTSIDGTLNINGDVDFGNSGTIDFTGATITGIKIGNAGSIEFETENDPAFWSNGSINTEDYSYIFNFPTNQSDATAPLLIGWNDRPYLKPFLETSIGASEATQGVFKRSISIEGGNATETRVPGNVYLTFGRNISAATFGDIIIGNAGAGDIYIGKDPANNTSHTGTINIGGNNSSTALRGDVDFANATITNWEDPNVVNKAGASAKLSVGGNTATMDFLTVRIAENTPGELDVEFNYDPSSGTVAVSANGDLANRFSGTTNFTAGNTTWTVMNVLTTVGDKGEMTIVDHSGHYIYRITTFAGEMPGVNPGDAYCVIERLK